MSAFMSVSHCWYVHWTSGNHGMYSCQNTKLASKWQIQTMLLLVWQFKDSSLNTWQTFHSSVKFFPHCFLFVDVLCCNYFLLLWYLHSYQSNTAKTVLDTILSIQPKDSGGGGGDTREVVVQRMADDMLSKLPDDYIPFEVLPQLIMQSFCC